MKHIICVNILLINMLSYCAADTKPDKFISCRLDNMLRNMVRPLAIYISPPSIEDIAWGDSPTPMDTAIHGLCTLECAALNTQFPLWFHNTKQQQINHTQKALRLVSTLQDLRRFKTKATSDNIDAKCFNIASNLTTIATLGFLIRSMPVMSCSLLLATICLKYKTVKTMPLYDLDTIEQHTVS